MVGIGDLFLPPLSTVQLLHYDTGARAPCISFTATNHRETRSRQPAVAAPHINITDAGAQLLARHCGCAQCAWEGDILGFRDQPEGDADKGHVERRVELVKALAAPIASSSVSSAQR